MSSPYMFFLKFMRQRGTQMDDSEVRTMWLIISALYLLASVVLVGSALQLRLRRAWQRALLGKRVAPLR